jgi:hypothetical protein
MMRQVRDDVKVEGVQRFLACCGGAGAEQRVPTHKTWKRVSRSHKVVRHRQGKAAHGECDEVLGYAVGVERVQRLTCCCGAGAQQRMPASR